MFWHDTQYHFFDYKYNIPGYNGQDYDGPARWFYLVLALVLIAALLVIFRKANKKAVTWYIRIMAIVMPILEISKIWWESYWDITTGRGFNIEGLLPIYTCSLFIYCLIVAAFTKGKVQRYPLSWLSSIGILGGMSNVLFIRGLKWYPFFTFGAFYSMFFHFAMVFTGLFLYVTRYIEFNWKDIFKGFAVQFVFSLIVIPLDYVYHWDYMQYYEAGGVPLIEDLCSKLRENGMNFMPAILMTILYLAFCGIFIGVYIGIDKLIKLTKSKNKKEAAQ